MSQRRAHTFLEALASTGFGFLLSIAVWPPVSVHLLHRAPALGEGLLVVSVYTAISVVRGYAVRRFFNWIHTQPSSPQRCFCGRRAIVCATHGSPLCRYHAGLDR